MAQAPLTPSQIHYYIVVDILGKALYYIIQIDSMIRLVGSFLDFRNIVECLRIVQLRNCCRNSEFMNVNANIVLLFAQIWTVVIKYPLMDYWITLKMAILWLKSSMNFQLPKR